MATKHTWQEELDIVDRTMKAISGVTDPEQFVNIYFEQIGELMPFDDYVSVSRRGVEAPDYLVTRSSRFTENFNPWTQRHRLPRLRGGILSEILYAGKPVVIDDLPARLKPDDPAYFYLEGFATLVSFPQYDNYEALNCTMMLIPPGIELDRHTVPTMYWQGGLFGRGTQNLVLRNQLAAALAAQDHELKVVGDIQRSLLPGDLPKIPGFDVAVFYQTSAQAGGDYYDFFPLKDGQWGLFIADVSGHGTPAAVLMAITHALAHAQPGTHTPPAQLLKYLNGHLTRSYARNGTFVTAFYAVLDPAARTLTYSNAGHNPPRLVRKHGVLSIDQNGSLPLGIDAAESYAETTLSLEACDTLLLYTDGITEAMARRNSASPELFGTDRLDQLLLTCPEKTAEDALACIRAELAAFTSNAPLSDDQTLIAIRCGGA